MKTIACLVLCWAITSNLSAEIINACSIELQKAEQAYNNLKALIDSKNLETPQLGRILKRFNGIKREIKQLKECASRTNQLIEILDELHPQLSFEILQVRDSNGKRVNIYLNVLAEDQMLPSVFGSTSLDHITGDLNTPKSSYGPGTVLVSIKHSSRHRMMTLLVHEFAHIKYLVPNLASYINYFKTTYSGNNEIGFGHHYDDPSSLLVKQELKRYAKLLKGETPDTTENHQLFLANLKRNHNTIR